MDPIEKLDLVAAFSRRCSHIIYSHTDAEILEHLADLRGVIARAENRLRKPRIIDPMIERDSDDL